MSIIADLDPKRDLGLIRERIEVQLARNEDPSETLRDLAMRSPIALAEMVIGPRAPKDPRWVGRALDSIDQLEEAIAPNGLYRKLIHSCPSLQTEILTLAAQRHPAARWLIETSRSVEGQHAGTIHLTASSSHPSFTQNCWAHAAAGHLPGLIAIASKTGRPEPAAALARHNHVEAAAVAMIRAIEHNPDAQVVAHVAAAWGPDIGPLLHKTLPHLRSKIAAGSLRNQAQGYPAFCMLLGTIVSAMVTT